MSDIESDERICTRCRAVMTYEPDDEATTVCHSCAYVALDEMGRELAEAQSRIADLERALASSVTAQENLAAELRTARGELEAARAEIEKLRADCAQTADGERAADREVERLQRERNEARCNAEDWADACAAANAQLLEVAEQLGTTDTTNLADRVRARLAGQGTQTEHVITESARRMFEAYLAVPEVDIDAESDRARDLVRYFLSMARVFADTEVQDRARRAERRQS